MGKSNQNLKNQKGNKILTACIGQCVHVAGTYNFVNIATQLGFNCLFLGPATPISEIINNIRSYKPNILGLSYRLTPSTIKPILEKIP